VFVVVWEADKGREDRENDSKAPPIIKPIDCPLRRRFRGNVGVNLGEFNSERKTLANGISDEEFSVLISPESEGVTVLLTELTNKFRREAGIAAWEERECGVLGVGCTWRKTLVLSLFLVI